MQANLSCAVACRHGQCPIIHDSVNPTSHLKRPCFQCFLRTGSPGRVPEYSESAVKRPDPEYLFWPLFALVGLNGAAEQLHALEVRIERQLLEAAAKRDRHLEQVDDLPQGTTGFGLGVSELLGEMSETICIRCGQPGELLDEGHGWIRPECRRCRRPSGRN